MPKVINTSDSQIQVAPRGYKILVLQARSSYIFKDDAEYNAYRAILRHFSHLIKWDMTDSSVLFRLAAMEAEQKSAAAQAAPIAPPATTAPVVEAPVEPKVEEVAPPVVHAAPASEAAAPNEEKRRGPKPKVKPLEEPAKE